MSWRCVVQCLAGSLMLTTAIQAEVIELEGTVTAVDADARTISIERKTAKGAKTLDLEVAKKAGNLDSVKAGDRIAFSYDPGLEVVTKLGAGAGSSEFDSSAFFNDLQSLQGTWITTSSVIGGKPIDAATLANQGNKLEVLGTTLVFHASLPTREVRNERTFSIDPSPKHITLWWRDADGKAVQGIGIYALDGDTLRICYAYNSDGVTARPTAFESVPGPPANAFHTYKKKR